MQPNKTVVGSYGAHSLYNVYFRTYNKNYGPGYNLIFRNIEISHDKELNSDNIREFAYGYNFWIDHCEFVGHSGINTASTGLDDWDKFLNFKGNTDNDNTDFITVSDCKFGLHEYGVLIGYYYEYLLTAYYINLAKNKGAVPVLVTPHKEVI